MYSLPFMVRIVINYTGMAGYHMISAINNNLLLFSEKKNNESNHQNFTVDVMTRTAITEQYAL